MRQTLNHPIRVSWNARMSSRHLNELLNTPNIHEDDEDAIMGELWLRDVDLQDAINANWAARDAQQPDSSQPQVEEVQ
jgi:hypothetical protein